MCIIGLIQLAETSQVIGTFGVHNIDFRKGFCEISYGVAPKFWGNYFFGKVGIFFPSPNFCVEHEFEVFRKS